MAQAHIPGDIQSDSRRFCPKSGLRSRAALFVILILMVGTVRESHAFERDPKLRAVTNAGLYGAAAGTLAGLISAPISGSGRNIFIGTSVGLYLGLVVGIYHITHMDDPGNPLRNSESAAADLLPAGPALPSSDIEVKFQVARF